MKFFLIKPIVGFPYSHKSTENSPACLVVWRYRRHGPSTVIGKFTQLILQDSTVYTSVDPTTWVNPHGLSVFIFNVVYLKVHYFVLCSTILYCISITTTAALLQCWVLVTTKKQSSTIYSAGAVHFFYHHVVQWSDLWKNIQPHGHDSICALCRRSFSFSPTGWVVRGSDGKAQVMAWFPLNGILPK